MEEELQASSRQAAKKPPAVRHGRLRPRNSWLGPLKVAATVVAVIALSATSISAYAAWDLATTAKAGVQLDNEDELGALPSIGAIDGGVNLLLVGSDRRPADGAFGDPEEESAVLNDVTMLLHISQDHSSATVVSFPRDLLVPMPECTDENGDTSGPASAVKINTTLSYGGLACTVATVEQLTGLSIPFAAEIEFYGVAAMSDAVGGVTVCVAEDIEDEYTQTFLTAGEHTLQGLPALQFLRTRHGVGDGSDLGRISNQQVFLSSLVRKLTSDGTLSDPAKLYGLAKAALGNVTLSNSLRDVGRMVSMALALKDIPLDRIVFVQFPTVYAPGGGAVIPEVNGADALTAALASDQPLQLTGGAGGGAFIDEAATAAEQQAAAPAAPAPSASASASAAPVDPAASAPPVAVLPESVKGSTAGTVTCSNGRTLGDQ